VIDRTEEEIMRNWKGDPSKPVVSVCCITYNHEKYIEEALDSFLMQETDFPFEIVIDDDASTDNTPNIIKRYKEKYPNIINENLRKENVGSFNNYIGNQVRAQGKYIAICDGDDFWTDPCKLQKQFCFLEKNHSYTMVCANSFMLDMDRPDFRRLSKEHNINIEDYTDKDFILMNPVSNLTIMYRNILSKSFPSLYLKFTLVDLSRNLMLAQHGKCRYFNDVVGVNRLHDKGITAHYRVKDLRQKIKTIEESIEFTKEWNDFFDNKYQNIINDFIQNRKARLVELYLRIYKIDKAIEIANSIDNDELIRSQKKRLIILILQKVSSFNSFIKNIFMKLK
jgi:glycosyltransferase involved in cell wall biosynthesis